MYDAAAHEEIPTWLKGRGGGMKGSEFKKGIRAGKVVVGFQQFLPSPALTEMAGIAGFDWLWLCIEHGSSAIGKELEDIIRTADGAGMVSIVRVTNNEYSIISRCLDMGATGVMVPRVRNRADVEHAIELVKYPPLGRRGICEITRVYDYGTHAVDPEDVNDETVVMLIIEQVEAFDNLEDILSVPGVDCVMFGGGDLSLELGIRRRALDGEPEALEIVNGYRRRFIEVCRRHNMPMAEPVKDVARIPEVVQDGFTVLASAPDAGLILGAMTSVVQGTRRASAVTEARVRA